MATASDKPPLFLVNVRHMKHGQLLHVIGERSTVVEAALNVILDSTGRWDERANEGILFELMTQRFDRNN